MTGDKPPAESDIKAAFAKAPAQQVPQQTPEDKITGIPKTLLNFSQGVGGFANDIGLGGATDAIASSGPMQAVQKLTGVNPAENSQLMQKKAQNPLMTAVGDVAGAGSWLMPVSQAGLLARGATGALQGGLAAGSKEGASPTSIGVDAGIGGTINALVPGAGKLLEAAIGRGAFGKSGAQFRNLVKESGSITGGVRKTSPTKATLGENLWNKTKNLDTQFTDLLKQTGAKMTKADIFGTTTAGGQVEGGFIPQALGRVGPSMEAGAGDYLNKLESSLTSAHQQYLLKQGVNSSAALRLAQNPATAIPHEVLQQFLTKVRNDISPNSWMQKLLGNAVSDSTDRVATDFTRQLRQKLGETSVNPTEYDRLQLLRQARGDISSHLQKGKQGGNFIKHLLAEGVPLEILGAILHLTAPMTAAAVAGPVLTHPAVASRVISGMESPQASALRQAAQKLMTQGTGSALATPTQSPQ